MSDSPAASQKGKNKPQNLFVPMIADCSSPHSLSIPLFFCLNACGEMAKFIFLMLDKEQILLKTLFYYQ